MIRKRSLTLVITTLFPLLVQAETDPELAEELKSLQEAYSYTTTASKVRENIDKSIATVTVIPQQQIRNMAARNLLDVLRVVPGLGITQSEYGFREIEARGVKTALSEKILIMLNGHPVDHNLQNSGSAWVYDDLPIDNIKRVEVVRGSGSALYGANAFLAVINIITQEPDDIDGVELTARGGSFGTQQYHLTAGKNINNLKVGADFHYTDTHGIHALISEKTPGSTGQPTSAPGYSKPREQRYDLGWNAEYKGFKLDGRFINKNTGTFVGFGTFGPDSKQEYNDYFVRGGYETNLTEQLSINTKITYSAFSFNNIWQLQPNLFFKAAMLDTKLGGETQLTYRFNTDNTVILGFSAQQQSQSHPISQAGTSPNNLQTTAAWGIATKRFVWSVYGQEMWDIFDNLRLVAGARFDNYSDFGSTFNPRVGLNWEISKGYSARFSYGTAFRAPSFGEITLINNAALLGNSGLSPESIKTFELGFSAHFTDALQSQITLYHSRIKNLITLVPISATVQQYQNIGQATTQGIELEGKYSFTKNTYLSFNYVYQNAKDGNQQRLANTPQHRANIMANIELTEHLNFYADTLLKGSTSRAVGDNRTDTAAYGLINTALTAVDVGVKGWEARFSLFNLLNKNYSAPTSIGSPYNDMPQPGRAFFGSIKIRF